MIFASFALLSGMVLSATAAPGYYPPAPEYSPPAPGYSPPAPVTHWVNVSNDNAELFYNPPYISAKVGDKISFKFHPKNHTVTQSSFEYPCTPLYGGTDTGFIPVAPGTYYDDLPVRDFIVEHEKPIWIHCRQGENTAGSHCGQGMVFAVNPGPDGSYNSFYAFKQKALEIGKKLAASNGTKY